MNGPEHYAEAEQLLGQAQEVAFRSAEGAHAIGAQAQVHATLALVAAIAELRISPQEGCGPSGDLTIHTALVEDGWAPGTWAGVIRSTIGDQA